MILKKMIKIIFCLTLLSAGLVVRGSSAALRQGLQDLVTYEQAVARIKTDIGDLNTKLSQVLSKLDAADRKKLGVTDAQALAAVEKALKTFRQDINGLAKDVATASAKDLDKYVRDITKLQQDQQRLNALRLQQETDSFTAKIDSIMAAIKDPQSQDLIRELMTQLSPAITQAANIVTQGQKEQLQEKLNFLASPTKMGTVMGSLVALYVGVKGVQLAHWQAQKYLETPRIAKETNVPTFFESIFGRSKHVYPRIKDVMLDQDTHDQMMDIALAIRNTKKNKGRFTNYMFWGHSGTGKTMMAEALANDCDCLYVLFTGSSFASLKPEVAIPQIDQLFDWAKVQTKPVVIIIDEAEGLLKERGETVAESTQQIMTHLMSKIGTPNDKYLLIACTNRPFEFDEAMQTRFPGSVEVKLPASEQRLQILESDIKRELKAKKIDTSLLSEDKLTEIAARTEGMCGRDLTTLVLDLEKAANNSNGRMLTEETIEKVVALNIKRFNNRKNGFQRTDKTVKRMQVAA